jgi:hypothetical protein
MDLSVQSRSGCVWVATRDLADHAVKSQFHADRVVTEAVVSEPRSAGVL